jgi:hypothetical protein
MMAMVQVRRPSVGQAYYRRKLAEGKSPKEALRCLKRRLSDASTDACWPIRISSGVRLTEAGVTRRSGRGVRFRRCDPKPGTNW